MNRSILIVGDNRDEREALAAFLRADYAILEADSGERALLRLRGEAERVSAIVMDVVASGIDGFEILKQIKANALWLQIPVIVTTSLDDEDSRERAIACGADNFVTKPYNRALLLHVVQNAIKLRETAAIANALWRDGTTGLLNRESFFSEAERMIRRHEPGYYMLTCFDVENFKVINDQYGTDSGDAVLRHIANCLNDFVAEINGLSCRYMADKFALLYPAELKDAEGTRQCYLAAAAPACIGRPLRIRIGRYHVTDPALPVSAMFDRAAMAENSVKGRYDSYIAQYSESMREDLLRKQQIVNEMQGALDNGEFEPWFQPQYNHATGAMIGAEALVRWRRNGHIVPPDDFIPVFEQNGFIYEVDQWIWRQVCACLRRWLDAGKAPLPVSVNISRHDLFQRDFLQVIDALVKEYALPVSLLRLEITESAFAESSKTIIRVVNALITQGFTVEIDDFGSGYSSLNTLKDVPASILKLDMKFFENTQNAQRGGNIVESVVRMAKWLDMAVIAEGVEDRAQADYLRSIGCYYIQGYYYARPMPLADYEALLCGSAREPELTRLKTLDTLDNSEFWNPKSMETLIFNSYVGGACIFEYQNGQSELLRVNEQYARELGGLVKPGALLASVSLVRFLDAANRQKMIDAVQRAIDAHKEASCEVCLTEGAHTEYLRVTVRLIARASERCLFYGVIVNLTEQRVAQRKQAESARQLEVIMSNVNGGVSAIQIEDDGSSRFIFNNDKYYALYGYTRAQAMAERLNVLKAIVPEDYPAVMEKVKKLKADRRPAIIDYRITRRDGSLAYLRVNASMMRMDGYGDVITAVVTDITEQRELSDRFRALIDNINGGVSAVYLRGGKMEFVMVNDQYFDLIGYTRAQFETELSSAFDLVHPDDRARVERRFREAGARPGKYVMEYRIRRRDGQVRSVLCHTNVIRLFGVDVPVQLAVTSDITALRAAQRKESEAADKLSAVLNHAGNGITAIALRGECPDFLFANDKYFEIIGYTRKAYAAVTRDDMLAPVYADDREALRRQVSEINVGRGSLTAEYRVCRADGSVVWVRSAITITHLSGVDAPVQIAVFSDITAEREASDQLRFLNDSAHDILGQPDSDAAINRTLEKLRAYFAGDRAYVIELDDEKQVSSNSYESCAPGVTSEMARLQGVPFSVSQDWFDALGDNRYVVIEDVAGIGEDRAAMRTLLLAQNIRSLIVAPLSRDGRLVGFVGIDNPSRATHQLDRLKALGDYIAVLLTRRDLNRELEHSREAMQRLIDDTPGGFLRAALRDGAPPRIVAVNAGFCRMLGMNREALMAAFGADAYGCIDMEALAPAAERALAEDEQFGGECRLRRGDGGTLWAMMFGRFVRDAKGDSCLNAYFTDISAQKRAEAQQRELLDNLPCGAALYEYDGSNLSVVHINQSYWRLVGRAPADYSRTSVMDAIHPDDRPIVHQEIEAAIRQARNVSVNLRILCGQAEYKPFHIDAKLAPNGRGGQRFFAAYTPLSGRDLSVQEMLPVALATMMSVSEELSYLKDRDLRYICCSESVARMLGLSSVRDIIGKTDGELFDARLARDFAERDARIIQNGESLVNFTERVQDCEGQTHLVNTSKYPILDAEGEVIGLYGISRDVTAQREKESQLELLAGSIPGGLATYAIDEHDVRLLYFNDGYCAFSGFGREDYARAVAGDPLAFVFEEDKPKLREMIRGFVEHKIDGHVNGCVYRCHTRDGGYRWMSLKTVLARIGDDQYIVNAVQIDITEQEEERERLRVSEEFNRLAIELSGNIITRFDVRDRTLTLPDSFNPIFVLPQVLNNMPEEQIALGRVSSDTAEAYRGLFEDIVRGRASGSATYKQNSTKGWRWLEAQYTTVFSNAGKPVSAVISFADVTEKLEKEVVYNKWRQSLKERPAQAYTLFRCNLSKNASLDSREGSLLKIDFDDAQLGFDDRTAQYVRRCVHPGDRARYLAFLNSDALLAEYGRGHRLDSMEYRELDAGGGARWRRLTVELVEYPGSRDIEAYLMFEDIDAQKRTELLTQERSERDPLTGILNRTTFIAKMGEIMGARRPGEKHALMMLDVDNFKRVNDTLGHDAGDQVLRELTERIRAILRHDDLIGRLGGDEFFVFLKGVANAAAAAAKAEQICALRIMEQGADAAVTASIGIAMIPDDGDDFETLYKKVDRALYRQKARGKNGFLFVNE